MGLRSSAVPVIGAYHRSSVAGRNWHSSGMCGGAGEHPDVFRGNVEDEDIRKFPPGEP